MNELLEKIHGRAYWRVIIRPIEFDAKRVGSLSECKHIIESSQVVLRGWDYPHIEEVRPLDGWIESDCDWDGRHLEYWRFYTTAQFVHHFAAIEEFHNLRRSPAPERYMLVLNLLYTVTEIFEFSARLAEHEILRPGAEITIQLHGMAGRELTHQDLMQSIGFGPYVATLDEINFKTEVSDAGLRGQAKDLAMDAAIALFERFGWFNPPRSQLVEEQGKLLERRLGV